VVYEVLSCSRAGLVKGLQVACLDGVGREDNVAAADRWIDKLFDAFDAIGDTPGLSHKREDVTAYPVRLGAWPSIAPHRDPLCRRCLSRV